ncbi:MAG TPA: hypothetical protein VMS54_12670, partial [Vicinamibacterales bacterium]|nr:hypothetical protein [Vicinamibacterales bacterium]
EIKPLGTLPFGYNSSTWWDLGLTAGGALYYRIFPQSLSDVQLVRANLATGEVSAVRTNAANTYIGASSGPVISADGRQLAFLSRRSSREQVVVVRSLVTGENRDLRTDLTNIASLSWAPEAAALFCNARAGNGTGLYRIDLQTGAATLVTMTSGAIRQLSDDGARLYYEDNAPGGATGRSVMQLEFASGRISEVHRGEIGGAFRLALSPDGRTIYYRDPVRNAEATHRLIVKDVTTGRESVLVAGRQLGALQLSPDGRFLVTPSPNPATKQPALLLIRTDGSGVKELPDGFAFVAWWPGSRSIIAAKTLSPMSATGSRYWLVPTDGGAPTPLSLPLNGRNLGRITAAGEWIAFAESDPGGAPNPAAISQLWVLENFIPKAQGGRGAGGTR